MNEPGLKYYGKDMPEMPVYINGTPLRFEVLATADAPLISALDRCIATQQGGVYAISKEQYDEAIKKKPPEIRSESAYKQQRRRQELSALQDQRLVAVVDGGETRVGGMFARPQNVGRDHRPNNSFGLPGGAAGPSGGQRIPDPVEVPDRSKIAADRPTTAKLGSMT